MRACLITVALASLTVFLRLHVSSAAVATLNRNSQSDQNLRPIKSGVKDGQFYDEENYDGGRVQLEISTEAAEVTQLNKNYKNGEKLNSTVAAAPSKKSSVLILIRDALKKVTSGLPTAAQQLDTTNALQYFTLFENFLQQTIEQVIGDDEEEASTVKIEVEGTEDAGIKAPTTETLSQQMEHDIGTINGDKKPSETLEQIDVPTSEAAISTN